MAEDLTRREFMSAAGGAVGLALVPGARTRSTPPEKQADGAVVLFQGDSITDAGRNRRSTEANQAGALGTGYPLLAAAAALRAHPDRGLRFYNRGISGNKVPDLRERWEADTLALQPDVLSVLIGVNDFWHRAKHGYTGTVQDYENGYVELLESTRRALPATRLIVLEPFVLRAGEVGAEWFPEFDERRAAAARAARRVGARFVPLQALFDGLLAQAGPSYWAADGVHPTPAGHAVIADAWRDAAGL